MPFLFVGLLCRRLATREKRHDKQQNDCSEQRGEQRTDSAHRQPAEQRHKPAAQQTADKTHNKIDDKAGATTLDNKVGEPPRNQADK